MTIPIDLKIRHLIGGDFETFETENLKEFVVRRRISN